MVKRFGGLVAVDNVDLDLAAGEVLALVGDNGAGKSTLVQMISGVFRADGGTVSLDGEQKVFASPEDARAAGIETIYQDLALCDNLTAADNIFLGREIRRRRFGLLPGLDQAEMRDRARTVLDELHIRIPDLNAPVRALSGGQRQAVAISRAVYWQARIMVMDEPTAALGVPEQRKVMDLIRLLKSRGVPVILISHNMQDVFEISDRIFVMRRGAKVGDFPTSATEPNEIVRAMIGG
ncbi:MAG: sugar ABC transporter ATP-binding protein [Bauldia sp.]|uniref:ATP-binding cassette domain-containing protein n=1 Tax=Bauldia sp. TaxID=2575872 RepID=UPI001D1D997A|nr:ATP-binding cassette domain-containing protein [Bauldia sp.]MCB1497356.1 sugar ABC transporter ATP-binding protein [Bauldia sp.]